jgi:CTP synthase
MQIACRCEKELERSTMDKVSMFCHVQPAQVMGVHNVQSTYHVPLLLKDQGLITYLQTRLNLSSIDVGDKGRQRGDSLMTRWKHLTSG